MNPAQSATAHAMRQAFRQSLAQDCDSVEDVEAQLAGLHEAGSRLLRYLQTAPLPDLPGLDGAEARALLLTQLHAAMTEVRSAKLDG